MKKIYSILILFLLLLKSTTGFCTTHTIINAGFTFSPDSISASLGDTVIFTINPIHSAVEVDQAIWNVNGSTPNGGFQVPFGGGMVVLTQVKTYFYVCGLHFSMGMKGRIFVTDPSGVNPVSNPVDSWEIVPNPATASAVVKTNLPAGKENSMRIYDTNGKVLFVKENISPFETLDLSGFPAGIYSVEIKGEHILMDKKLTVLK